MLRLSYLAAFVGIGVAGCGLIDSSVTDFDLRFPQHDFQIDTADWHLTTADQLPSVACSQDCEVAGDALCTGDVCSVDCDSGSQQCQARVRITLRNDFDLAAQAPEFQAIADQPIISVTIDDVYFDITENTLNLATPPLGVYIGPASATAPTDSNVRLVGTIASLPEGTLGRRPLQFESGGQQLIKDYMDNFHTPFRVFVSGEVTFRGGTETPRGRLVGSVQAEAHVGID